jgi:two-component system LytT family sensor kinase
MKVAPSLKIFGRHMVFIAAYYFYEIGMLYVYTGQGVYFWDALVHLAINLCFFYFNAHFVLSFISSRSTGLKVAFYATVFIPAEFLSFLAFKYLVAQLYVHFGIEATHPYVNWERFLRDVIWRFIYLFGLSSAYWFAISSSEKQRALAALEHLRLKELAEQESVKAEMLKTENAYLRSQINSHFLFNTLSYVYSSVQDRKEVGETILHLSDILRYSFKTTATGKVKLEEEIEHIQHIFSISRLKSSKPLQLDFSITGEPGGRQIIPLLLITLTENMLKYADFHDPFQPAKFHCLMENSSLTIRIHNKKRPSVSPFSNGIGMKNTKKRLNLAYQDNYSLKVIDSATLYELELIIPLEDAIQNPNR